MVRLKQKGRRIPFTKGRTSSLMNFPWCDWEEKAQEDNTLKKWTRLRIFVKKFTGIFF
jgi:hypothetical protein